MIFVTVGSSTIPFDRLLTQVNALSGDEEIVVQRGASAVEVTRGTAIDFLGHEAFLDYVGRARVVVTHAGVGSIMAALAHGKRPVVVPRRREHGEAVDDHQVELAANLADKGLITLLDDPAHLESAVAEAASAGRNGSGESALALELRDVIAGWVNGA